ncbi:uncharacterized protein LOC105421247 [Amborella trichopoda]|uniref:uncharacterized protein LOC105421247 n=1 Tax=Amborella trichopoda TaxID=13333 RepID=UPI0005D32AB2|nr:uncharacterized protein LOC105421247 [Amborella trichopoda]|eukprot:XP_011626221.1 uncharacterized protein LOC105421247 [Amborella trichopoda]
MVNADPKPFRLNLERLEMDGVVEMIKGACTNCVDDGTMDLQLHNILLIIKRKLLNWKKENHFDIKRNLEKVLLDIECLDQNIQESGCFTEQFFLERSEKLIELHDIRRVEEIYWRQKSRFKWLKEWDLNIKFFHAIVSARRRQNDISGLTFPAIDSDDDKAIKLAMIDHFKKVFSKEVSFTPKLHRIPFKMLPNNEQSHREREVALEELMRVVFALLDDKALGPDGFPLDFFHKFC